ncbi:MAG: ABC transporter ATP-binding protein [Patescibacteria group bacterium]
MEEKKPIIKIRNLNVTYFLGKLNEVRALKKINLDIYPGEFIIFFGPSGCGKSTLLYSIAGLETNTAGDIFIQDKNIAKLNYKELEEMHQKKIGMIFQAYYLINSLSIFKNVILPQIAIGGNTKEREKRAMNLLAHFGVKEQANKFPNELSGGQQQRVAITRSLMNDPEILLADEPVGNLDSRSAEDVLALLKDLNRRDKKTVILVTHNPASLGIADRVFFIKDGEITKVEANRQGITPITKEMPGTPVSKELELLGRTFSDISGAVGNLLAPFKAKQIVSEALLEMSGEEIGMIEKRVANLMMSGAKSGSQDNSLFKYLDDEIERGGLGMNKRAALSLSVKIRNIIEEIRILEKRDEEIISGKGEIGSAVGRIRSYLLKSFDVKTPDLASVKVIDEAIKMRLENKIDRNAFSKKIDLSPQKGGAGLDKRVTRKIARRLELLILGKFK